MFVGGWSRHDARLLVRLRIGQEPWMAEDESILDTTQGADAAPDAVEARPGKSKVVEVFVDDMPSARATEREIGVASEDDAADALDLPELAVQKARSEPALSLGLLDDVSLHVRVELGRTQMYLEDILRLNTSSVVELDRAAGDPVDVYVNDRLVARGEVLVLNDNFCVRISEIVTPTTVNRNG